MYSCEDAEQTAQHILQECRLLRPLTMSLRAGQACGCSEDDRQLPFESWSLRVIKTTTTATTTTIKQGNIYFQRKPEFQHLMSLWFHPKPSSSVKKKSLINSAESVFWVGFRAKFTLAAMQKIYKSWKDRKELNLMSQLPFQSRVKYSFIISDQSFTDTSKKLHINKSDEV